jgi:hypothetical protein
MPTWLVKREHKERQLQSAVFHLQAESRLLCLRLVLGQLDQLLLARVSMLFLHQGVFDHYMSIEQFAAVRRLSGHPVTVPSVRGRHGDEGGS